MIKAGTKLRITHSRKGIFECIATRDFDPKTETFFPVRLISEKIGGASKVWQEGDEVPCRSGLVIKMEEI